MPLHGILATFGLVRYHTANSTPENLSRCAEMKRTPQRFDVASKSQELQVLQLVTVEITVHDEFSDCGGQSAHQMATGIDHDRLRCESSHFVCAFEDLIRGAARGRYFREKSKRTRDG